MTKHDQQNDAIVPDDTGMPSVNNQQAKKPGAKIGPIVIGIVAILAIVGVNGGFSDAEGDRKKEEAQLAKANDQVRNNLPALPPPPPPKEEKPTVEPIVLTTPPPRPAILNTRDVAPAPPPPIQTRPQLASAPQSKEKPTPTPQERKMSSPLLIGSSTAGQGVNQPPSNRGASGGSFMAENSNPYQAGDDVNQADGLASKLKATQLQGASASLIKHRSFMVTKGAFLNCALETAISSDVAGMTSCRLTRDVYSNNGKVVLMEAGSRIVGEYTGALEKGMARLFVLWTRLETPNGVIIELDSPGTDTLGRAGHSGYVDRHFWQRFGGAMLISVIDDLAEYATARATNADNSETTVQFGNSQETAQNAATVALEHSIDIPATLHKNQGEAISIFVARDLDFRGVYSLELTN